MAEFNCPPNTYCSDQQATEVGANKTKIYHRTVTTLTGTGPAYTGSKTETYILRRQPDGAPIDSWQVAATTTDGGKTQTFTNAAGADFRKSMSPGGNMAKNTQIQTQQTLTKGLGRNSLGQNGAVLDKINPEQQKKLNIINPNVASPTGAGTSVGTKIDGDAILKVFEGEKKSTRNKFPTLKYPVNLESKFQDVIKFNMVKYEPKKFQAEKLEFDPRNIAGGTNRQIIGTVTLPIPAGISDMNACNWGGGDMNAFDAALGSVATKGVESGLGGATEEFGRLLDGIKGSTAEIKAAVTKIFVEKAVGSTGFFTRTTGLVVNSNLELLFGGPTLRPFSFTFKMSAREEGEAKEIRSIIRFFKQGMSPIRTQSSLFLKTPHTFQIQYRHKNEEHKFLNKFKECALTSFSVNYTPEGQYATYTDGAMVSYEMQMQFTELEPIFNDEYENSENAKDTEIGF